MMYTHDNQQQQKREEPQHNSAGVEYFVVGRPTANKSSCQITKEKLCVK